MFTKMNASSVKIDVRNSMNVTKLGLKHRTVGIKFLVKAQAQAHLWEEEEKTCSPPRLPIFLSKATLKMKEDSSWLSNFLPPTSNFPKENLFLNKKHSPENRMPKSWSMKTPHGCNT